MIDLEIKGGALGSCCVNSAGKDSEKCYPCFYIESDKEIELPESGEMEIKFRVKSETTSRVNGKERCSYTIEVVAILEAEGAEGEEEENGNGNGVERLDGMKATEAALDALRAAILKEEAQEALDGEHALGKAED